MTFFFKDLFWLLLAFIDRKRALKGGTEGKTLRKLVQVGIEPGLPRPEVCALPVCYTGTAIHDFQMKFQCWHLKDLHRCYHLSNWPY